MRWLAINECTWQSKAHWRQAAEMRFPTHLCSRAQPDIDDLSGTCSDAEAAVLQAGAALLGNANLVTAGSQDSGSAGPSQQPVPAAVAPAAQLVLEVLQHLYLLHCWSSVRHAARRAEHI